MSMNLRYPSITATTEREQIAQIKSYLFQLVEKLNYELSNLGTGDGGNIYDLKQFVLQELQKIQAIVNDLDAKHIKSSGWPANRILVTDANGKVKAAKLKFTLDGDGNINYEVEE